MTDHHTPTTGSTPGPAGVGEDHTLESASAGAASDAASREAAASTPTPEASTPNAANPDAEGADAVDGDNQSGADAGAAGDEGSAAEDSDAGTDSAVETSDARGDAAAEAPTREHADSSQDAARVGEDYAPESASNPPQTLSAEDGDTESAGEEEPGGGELAGDGDVPAEAAAGDGVPGAGGDDEDYLLPGQTSVPVGDEVVVDDDTMRRAIEAILMVTDEPLPVLTLARAVGRPTGDIEAALVALSAEYTEQGRGFDLREVGGGWRYYTRPEAAPYVERFVLDGQQARLTQAALETLAVVAYKQPVSRARVSAIRGVNVDGVMRTLVSRGLVEDAGADTESHATLYRTTSYFLERMGMQSLEDLPELAPYLPEMDDIEEELAAQVLPPTTSDDSAESATPAEADPGTTPSAEPGETAAEAGASEPAATLLDEEAAEPAETPAEDEAAAHDSENSASDAAVERAADAGSGIDGDLSTSSTDPDEAAAEDGGVVESGEARADQAGDEEPGDVPTADDAAGVEPAEDLGIDGDLSAGEPVEGESDQPDEAESVGRPEGISLAGEGGVPEETEERDGPEGAESREGARDGG